MLVNNNFASGYTAANSRFAGNAAPNFAGNTAEYQAQPQAAHLNGDEQGNQFLPLLLLPVALGAAVAGAAIWGAGGRAALGEITEHTGFIGIAKKWIQRPLSIAHDAISENLFRNKDVKKFIPKVVEETKAVAGEAEKSKGIWSSILDFIGYGSEETIAANKAAKTASGAIADVAAEAPKATPHASPATPSTPVTPPPATPSATATTPKIDDVELLRQQTQELRNAHLRKVFGFSA